MIRSVYDVSLELEEPLLVAALITRHLPKPTKNEKGVMYSSKPVFGLFEFWGELLPCLSRGQFPGRGVLRNLTLESIQRRCDFTNLGWPTPAAHYLGRPATEEDPALSPDGAEFKGSLRARNIVELAVIALAEKGVRSSIVRIPPIAHSDTDGAGFLPLLIGLAKEKGVIGYPGDGANRWPAVHSRDLAALFRLALEKGPAGKSWHGIEGEGIPFREIAEAIGRRLNLPVVSIPADVLMLPGYFGFLANLVTLDLPASNRITRQTLGWEPAQPGLLADLENGRYFPVA